MALYLVIHGNLRRQHVIHLLDQPQLAALLGLHLLDAVLVRYQDSRGSALRL